jgi:hypothetical protein
MVLAGCEFCLGGLEDTALKTRPWPLFPRGLVVGLGGLEDADP